MNQIIHIEDGEAVSLAGVSASPSAQASAAGSSVIKFPFQANSAAALLALESATSPDTFESLGDVAVRLVGSWSLPKLVCWSQREGED
ncbi:MAG: hypothetical protein AAAB13_20675 [Pseudomonas sp.]